MVYFYLGRLPFKFFALPVSQKINNAYYFDVVCV